MNTQRRSVNLVPGMSAPAVLHASEGDVGRVLEIVIIDGQLVYNIPSTATVTITATKPSGMGFTQACTVTENGTATFETTASMTDESGKMEAEVRIVDGGQNIGTANLLWVVERNPHPSNVIDGDVERAKTILERAEEAMAKAEEMIEKVDVYNSVVEEVEDARKGFNEVEYGTLGEAVRGQADTLQGEIDKLNDGGLIIKDNVIEADINEWLDKHPEATTTVQDGTVGLEKLSKNFAYLYNPYKGNTGEVYGAMAIIINDNKTIFVDFGKADSINYTKSFIDGLGVKSVDYAIISHYHGDHIGGLDKYLEAYDFSGCTFFLPFSVDYDSPLMAQGSAVTSYKSNEEKTIALIENIPDVTMVFPTQNQTVQLTKHLSVRFLNCEASFFDDYYQNVITSLTHEDRGTGCVVNNFSLISEFTHGANKFLLAGDVEELAQEKNASYIVQSPTVYKVEHHGANLYANTDWLNRINPRYAYRSGANLSDYIFLFGTETGRHLYRVDSTIISETTARNISFVSDGYDVLVSYDGTGANVNDSAILSTSGGVMIEKGTSITDITKQGNYYCRNATIAQTLSGFPIKNGGFGLKVISRNGFATEEYIAICYNQLGVYVATFINNGWEPWYALGTPESTRNVLSDCDDAIVPNMTYSAKGEQTANKPTTSGYFTIIPIMYNAKDSNGCQIAVPVNTTTPRMWLRNFSTKDGWGNWAEVDVGYLPGDTLIIDYKETCSGVITNSSKSLRFTIPLPRGLKAVTSVSISGGIIVRGVHGYINGSSAFNVSEFTISTDIHPNGITVSVNSDTAWTDEVGEALNNTPIAVSPSNLTIIFA